MHRHPSASCPILHSPQACGAGSATSRDKAQGLGVMFPNPPP